MRRRDRFIIVVSTIVILVAAALFVSLSTLLSLNDDEAETEREQVYWFLDDGHLEIYGSGPMTERPWVSDHSRQIRTVTVGDRVTTVIRNAFRDCTLLTDVLLGQGVTAIGDNAFAGCVGLTRVSLPRRVTVLGNEVFAGCTALQSVHLFGSVTSVGQNIFADCSALTDVYFEGTEAEWQALTDGAGEGFLPEGVTVHYEYSLRQLTYVSNGDGTCTVYGVADGRYSSLLIPSLSPDGETVTAIGERAFEGCETVTHAVIPGSVTTIGNRAFASCANLASVELTSGLTTVGEGAFYGCVSLSRLSLPATVTSMGANALAACQGLTEITFAEGSALSDVGAYAFRGCTSLSVLTFPSAMPRVPQGCLEDCTALTEVFLPLSVKEVGEAAFLNCHALTAVYYVGSEAEFENVSVGAFNEAFLAATLTTNYGEPTSQIKSVGLLLSNDITITYYAILEEGHEGALMRFTMNGKTTEVEGVLSDNGRYAYSFTGVTPQCMGDTICAELVRDGRLLDRVESYSVLAYCASVMQRDAQSMGFSEAKFAAMKTLLVDALTYGAQTQLYSGYKTDALVTDLLAEMLGYQPTPSEILPTVADDVMHLTDTTREGSGFTGVGVRFDSSPALFVHFESASDVRLVVRGDGKELYMVDYAGKNGTQVYSMEGIYAVDFNTVYTFELYAMASGNATLIQALTYSVNSYAYRTVKQANENGEMTDMARLCLALYRYGVSAEAYVFADRPRG